MIEGITRITPLRTALGYWYVATPYTRYPLGHTAAYQYARRISDSLDVRAVKHFSPIAVGHEIAARAGIDHDDLEFWMDFCEPFMKLAAGLLIVKLADWRKSDGIQEEIAYFERLGRPIYAMDPRDLLGFNIERDQLSFGSFEASAATELQTQAATLQGDRLAA